ncbi:MAG: phage tail spike protein [Acutalibacteraceae bacterium]
MISVYTSNETSFVRNGIKILKPLKALIFKQDNGEYYLDLKDSIDNFEYYQSGNIIRVPTPWGKQCFRIKNVSIQNNKVEVRAHHLFYDAENYIIADSYVVERNCNDALDHLNTATDNPSPFTAISDVPNIHNYRCVRKSLAEAIKDVLERWGGHLVRDNRKIEIRQTIGKDRGLNLVYGKNIVNIKADEDWSNVCTKIMPVGRDGLLLPETWLTYREDLYDIPYTKVVSFDQSNVNPEDYENAEQKVDEAKYKEALINDLRVKANNYLNENCVPKADYVLSEYLKGVSDIGDTIYVKHPKCKLELITKVISLEFDVILQRITKLEFGNFKSGNLGNLIETFDKKITESVDKKVDDSTANLRRELTEATDVLRDKLGNSYVVYEGDKILVLDQLPKEEARNVIMINSGGIGFSQTGINGVFNSAWTIDGTLDMQKINVINLVCDLIKGGTLRLGSNMNSSGLMELYNGANTLICQIDKDGITMFCHDGRTVKINAEDGFVGYAANGDKIYWVSESNFHMKKSVVEDEITIAQGLRFIPINTDTNHGIGIVAMV